jgi:hypothetical protein
MATCANCGNAGADLFDAGGNVICAACDARRRAADLEERAAIAQLDAPMSTALADGASGLPPWVLTLIGVFLLGAGLLFGAAEWFLVGRIHYVVFLIILAAGLGCLFYAMSAPAPMKRKPK